MKHWTLTLTAAALLAGASAQAALPPLYESLAELKSVINNPQLTKKLVSGELITKIEKNDQGFLISTNKHTLQAYIDYLPATRPGPAHYKVRFGDPKAL